MRPAARPGKRRSAGVKAHRFTEIVHSPKFRFGLFLLLLVVVFFAGQAYSLQVNQFLSRIRALPLLFSGLVFILVYVGGTFIFWYLKDPLKLAAAVIFGALLSTALIYVSEVINAWIFFRLSRALGKDYMESKLKGRGKRLYARLEETNLRTVILLRAIPLVPYRILDLCFGLSKFPFRKYLIAVLIASPPRIFFIQFPLAAVKEFSPEKIMDYFLTHPLVYAGYLVYVLASVIIAWKMKRLVR
ncbi:MAG: hypothetical protein GF333_03800 [Candidatus Omnitrophica bacterium]|nr:hypothetical protein [Candidatus Omnitrophota bacterium]